jgi:uncharacterized spore protein YtfJ
MAGTDAGTGVLDTLKDAIAQTGASRVFGTPIQHDGMTVLPVAKIGGGGGGGEGSGPAEGGREAAGTGGGFGVTARPAGVYVLRNGHVAWRPAVDVNRVVLGGQVVAVVALLVARSVLVGRRRSGARAKLRRSLVQSARRR